MPRIPSTGLERLFRKCDDASTNHEKGQALEDLICDVFGIVPGISVARRNTLSTFRDEEVDVALWNDKFPEGFPFLPHIILVECKNWSKPVGSMEVGWFVSKLEDRGLSFGILVALNSITGSSEERSSAHQTVARALSQGRQLIVIDRRTLEQLSTTDDLVRCIKEKLCDLAVAGTVLS